MTESLAQQERQKRAAGRKVLVVEDDQAMLEILLENLADAGFSVVTARDGLQAWQAYEKERPDLVTLDLDIPKISGFRLLQLLKQATPAASKGVPVIVVTGLDYEEAEDVAEAGADDFITKPFNPMELVDKVEAVLAKRC